MVFLFSIRPLNTEFGVISKSVWDGFQFCYVKIALELRFCSQVSKRDPDGVVLPNSLFFCSIFSYLGAKRLLSLVFASVLFRVVHNAYAFELVLAKS